MGSNWSIVLTHGGPRNVFISIAYYSLSLKETVTTRLVLKSRNWKNNDKRTALPKAENGENGPVKWSTPYN